MRTLLDTRSPRARKPHLCDECHEVIAVGHKYVTQAGIGDDGFCSSKLCLRCDAGWDCIWELIDAECIVFGELLEELHATCDSRNIDHRLPKPPLVDDKTLPLFGAENAPRVPPPPSYSSEVLRLVNLLRADMGRALIVLEPQK